MLIKLLESCTKVHSNYFRRSEISGLLYRPDHGRYIVLGIHTFDLVTSVSSIDPPPIDPYLLPGFLFGQTLKVGASGFRCKTFTSVT